MNKKHIISLTPQVPISKSPCTIEWWNISDIKPHEEYDPERAKQIALNMKKTGVTLLISITREGILLDGHHRFAAFRHLFIDKIPVAVFDYGDPRISTGSEVHTKLVVLESSLSEKVLPPKSTKHTFDVEGVKLPLIYFSQHFLIENC